MHNLKIVRTTIVGHLFCHIYKKQNSQKYITKEIKHVPNRTAKITRINEPTNENITLIISCTSMENVFLAEIEHYDDFRQIVRLQLFFY